MYRTISAFNPFSHEHHIDHLAAVALLLKVPLLLGDREVAARCKKLYPSLLIDMIDESEISPQKLSERFCALFTSDLWPKEKDSLFTKPLLMIHTPHGFSDKIFWLRQCLEQRLFLCYGRHMIEAIGADGRTDQFVTIGNLRYRFYLQEKNLYDAIIQRELFDHLHKNRPTILYAPTWNDQEDSSSFAKVIDPLCSFLKDDYNLIIKLHPLLCEFDPALVWTKRAMYEGRENLLFLSDFPLIYPLLQRCDLYLGDRSAIGYDFLAMNRPMIFFEKRRGAPSPIHHCGSSFSLTESSWQEFFSLLERSLHEDNPSQRERRRQLYEYTFDDSRPLAVIEEEIRGRIRNFLHGVSSVTNP